jgi:hypothetical protein
MEQNQIFGPVFIMMLLTLLVWIFMYSKRLSLIRSMNLDAQQLTPGEIARVSPPAVSNPSDNLKNLFEVPVLFYALMLYLFVTGQVDKFYLDAAWLFVFFRTLHSAVHCTINIVVVRFTFYVLSCGCLFFILLRAAIGFFT